MIRIDAGWQAQPPTYEDYPDKGCNVAPRCLDCPLPQCKEDVRRAPQAGGWFSGRRWQPIKAALLQGQQPQDIAAQYQVKPRSVRQLQERLLAGQ